MFRLPCLARQVQTPALALIHSKHSIDIPRDFLAARKAFLTESKTEGGGGIKIVRQDGGSSEEKEHNFFLNAVSILYPRYDSHKGVWQ